MTVEQGNWEGLGRCNPKVTPKGVPDMFPDTAEGRVIAKKFCAPCTVKRPCLDDALTEEIQLGVRGGKTEGERSRIIANRRREQDLSKPSI